MMYGSCAESRALALALLLERPPVLAVEPQALLKPRLSPLSVAFG